jgi:beta-lactamase class A
MNLDLARKAALPVLCLLAGGAAGYGVRALTAQDEGCQTFTEVREPGYRLVSPLLECDSDRDIIRNRELKPFESKVEALLRSLTLPGGGPDALAPPSQVEAAAVYFRELNDGLWFSIGEDLAFTPASMRKVPMMIAILKQAERMPDLLDRPVVADLGQDHNARQNFKPADPVELGKTYPVGELLARMIADSDNNAFMLLSRIVDPAELERVYGLLSMQPPTATGGESHTVLTYSAFFRVLYNATFLSKEMSDRALEVLTRVAFRRGIAAGVPEGIPVAHKFGERSDDSGAKQLHDCGIVYYPRHPYLLCMMTKGTDFDALADALGAISRTVFEEIDVQHDHQRRR